MEYGFCELLKTRLGWRYPPIRVIVLGEPTKIIGVEISQTNDSITLSQKIYIKSLLEREGRIQTETKETVAIHFLDFSESSNTLRIALDPISHLL